MKYATKNNLGKSKNTRKTKAKTTASTVGRICRLDEAGQKRFGNSKRPTEISSNKSTADGFLKCTFLPKLTNYFVMFVKIVGYENFNRQSN